MTGMATRIDDLCARWDRGDAPGCAVGVVRDGELVHEVYVGMADLEHGVRIGPGSVFDIASTSKQFTAAAILLLAQRGELSLDDDVQAYIPELPDYGAPITIRHLVHHTSGLRDYLALLHLAGAHEGDHFDAQDVLDLVCRQHDLNFPPGTQHSYCNSGYVLLAIIVTRVTGESFTAWTAREMLAPLAMSSSHFRDDATEVVPGLVQSYARRDDGSLRKTITNDDVAGDGGLLTTLRDLVNWERNFLEETVGGPGFTQTMSTPGTPDDDEERYGFGLSIGEYRGLRTVGHGGNLYGYSGEYLRFPDQRVAIFCLANLGGFDSPGLARRVADIALEDVLAPRDDPAPAGDTRPTPGDLLASLPGLYRQDVTGLVIEVARDGDALHAILVDRQAPLAWQSGATFATTFAEIALDVVFDGDRVRFEHEGEAMLTAQRIEPPDPAALDLRSYTGTFHSDELGIDAHVALDGDSLRLRRGRAVPDVLRPTLADEFSLGFGGVAFTRDGGGAVDGFRLSMSRTSAVSFTRAG